MFAGAGLSWSCGLCGESWTGPVAAAQGRELQRGALWWGGSEGVLCCEEGSRAFTGTPRLCRHRDRPARVPALSLIPPWRRSCCAQACPMSGSEAFMQALTVP